MQVLYAQGDRVLAALKYDVVVVGAGIVGASVAWHLAGQGLRVAVVDATGPAAAASGASDGAVSVASKKPGAMAELASASLLYTRELAEPGGVLSGVFEARPAFIVGTGPIEMAAMDQLCTKLSALDGPVQVVHDGSPSALPGVGPGVERLIRLQGEGHMLGYQAVGAYLAQAADHFWPCAVESWQADASSVTLQIRGGPTLVAAHMVCALGVSTPAVFPQLPVVPRAGQLIITDRGDAHALPGAITSAAYLRAKTVDKDVAEQAPVVIDPLATGQLLIGSSREDHGNAQHNDFRTLRGLVARATSIWPGLGQRRLLRVFTGVRAAVADGLPIVGPLPHAPRVVVATGFEGDGICLSALIGREVAQWVVHQRMSSVLSTALQALSPSRFVASAGEAAT